MAFQAFRVEAPPGLLRGPFWAHFGAQNGSQNGFGSAPKMAPKIGPPQRSQKWPPEAFQRPPSWPPNRSQIGLGPFPGPLGIPRDTLGPPPGPPDPPRGLPGPPRTLPGTPPGPLRDASGTPPGPLPGLLLESLRTPFPPPGARAHRAFKLAVGIGSRAPFSPPRGGGSTFGCPPSLPQHPKTPASRRLLQSETRPGGMREAIEL